MKQTHNNNAVERLGAVEKVIFDRYGKQGLNVYKLVNGTAMASEIMRKTGLGERQLVEILDFMDNQGIITLNHSSGSMTA